MRTLLPALAGLVLIALPPAAEAAADPAVSSFTLPNGLTGVVIEDHRAPVVTSMVWYKVGAADDPYGQSGLAHFLEHMMFKATDTLKDGEFSAIVAANGGEENAFTAYDYTAYFQHISKDRLDLVLGMEADRMVGLAPGPDTVAAERAVVIEERRMRIENAADGRFQEQTNAALYMNSPYGRPTIGWKHEMEQMTLDSAMAFYRAHYAPNNAVLVVAGDVTPVEVERLATEHFGPIPASDAIAPRSRPQEPPQLAARRIDFRDPRVSEPMVTRNYLAPQRKPGDQKQAAALEVLARLLGGSGITSVMGKALELDRKIAIDAGAYYADVSLDPRSFGLYVVPAPGVSLGDAEQALDALIAKFVADGPDPDQLDRIKTRIAAAEIYALDNQQGRAHRYGEALTSGLTVQDVSDWPDLLQAVTPTDVQAAARAVFRPETSVTGWMQAPEGRAPAADARGAEPPTPETEGTVIR